MDAQIRLPDLPDFLLREIAPPVVAFEPSASWTLSMSHGDGAEVPPLVRELCRRVLTSEGDLTSLKAVEADIDRSCDNAPLRVLLGSAYLRRRSTDDIASAIRHFRQAKSLAPSWFEPSYFLASAYQLAGELTAAHKAGRAALKVAATPGQRSDAEWLLAAIVCRQGNWAGGAEHLERALRATPDNDDVAKALAHNLVLAGRFEDALPILDRLIERAPHDEELQYALVTSLMHLGRNDDALVAASRAVDVVPWHPVLAFNLGAVLNGLGRYDEAISQFERAARLFEDNPQIAIDGAVALQAIAIVFVNRYVSDPSSPESTVWLERARDVLRAAIALAPNDSSIVTTDAVVCQVEGRLEIAVDRYLRALAIDPGNDIARTNIEHLRDHIATLDKDEQESLLAEAGVLRLGEGPIDESFWDLPAPDLPGALLSNAIEDDRDGR